MLLESIVPIIVDNVFGYALDQSGIAEQVRSKLHLDPTRKAFKRAVLETVEQFERQHPDWASSLFDADFFKKEGAAILAQFLLPDGHPDPSELARRWADSLNIHESEHRAIRIRELEPVATNFLADLGRSLRNAPELKEINDSRALERVAGGVDSISSHLETISSMLDIFRRRLENNQFTPGTCRDYLQWLIERNLYLDPRGTFQAQHQIQVKLDEVYISLRARHEGRPAAGEWLLPDEVEAEWDEKLIVSLSIAAEEEEGFRAQSRMDFDRRFAAPEDALSEILELAQAVSLHDRLVILGDPGSGKTTLLRYLALKHAQTLQDGRTEVGSGLGEVHFPIFVRIADYAEYGISEGKSLSDYLADYCIMHECPKDGLADLLIKKLTEGHCLVLLDGLDEVVSADVRRKVVQHIEEFVRRHREKSNRFVITSRIAGYSSAPLGKVFIAYSVEEMDEGQIERFLDRWCLAVETAQRPELSLAVWEPAARREVEGILRAVRNSPGVRRLAGNPLLLRNLAIIHRDRTQLPQKRVQLYREAADILARIWRTTQGVPESALVKEEYLTPLLSHLAYWLHTHKPSGIATEREVHEVLGAEWADLNDLHWESDKPNPRIREEVNTFLLAVREHTGLFVERAPKRYGFMHLTFEEYYAARYLVARSKKRARLIRNHLHDPRWEEPILLALAFVGLDSRLEAQELVETAILAAGEDAEVLGISPSEYEDLLGRDYLFALRCLGDNIPIHPRVMQRLIARLANELVYRTGSARYQRYQQLLWQKLEFLKGSQGAPTLLSLLVAAMGDVDPAARSRAAQSLGKLGQSSSAVLTALIAALHDSDYRVRSRAAGSLGRVGQATPEVMAALLASLHDDSDAIVRSQAARSLGQLGQATPEVVSALLDALQDIDFVVRYRTAKSLDLLGDSSAKVVSALLDTLQDPHPAVRLQIAKSLVHLGQVSSEIVSALFAALRDENPAVRTQAIEGLRQLMQTSEGEASLVTILLSTLRSGYAKGRRQAVESLGQLKQVPIKVISALLDALHDKQPEVRFRAAESLGKLKQAPTEVISALLSALLEDRDPGVRFRAAKSLGQLGQAFPEAVNVLLTAVHDSSPKVRFRSVESLGQLGQASPEVISALLTALRDEYATVRFRAAQSLGQLRQASPEVIPTLIPMLHDDNPIVRSHAAGSLGRLGQASPEVISALLAALHDDDVTVRFRAARSLQKLKQTTPEVISALLAALQDRDARVRYRVLENLEQLGKTSPEVISALHAALHDTSSKVRFRAAEILRELEQTSQEVVSVLLADLHDNDPAVRFKSVQSLGQLGHASSEVVTALLGASREGDAKIRSRAVESLGQLGQVSPEAISALLEVLKYSDDWLVRRDAARLLGKWGQSDEATIEALWNGLLDDSDNVRTACVEGLAQLGRRFPDTAETLKTKLVQAIEDPEFAKTDAVVNLPASEYAYDALWLQVAGSTVEER